MLVFFVEMPPFIIVLEGRLDEETAQQKVQEVRANPAGGIECVTPPGAPQPVFCDVQVAKVEEFQARHRAAVRFWQEKLSTGEWPWPPTDEA
jgi:hypothetical protein